MRTRNEKLYCHRVALEAPGEPDAEDARLRQAIRRHLRYIGLQGADEKIPVSDVHTKDSIRGYHRAQRAEKLAANKKLLERWPEYRQFFASGIDVDPEKIAPRLQLIDTDSPESKLFSFAALSWSVPTSQGYGRRLRFLCWDNSNNKLMGLIALGDPVFNLAVRDEFIGWTGDDRKERLSSVMDAYVLGALPPYNSLLGGKVLACLLKSREIFDLFNKKYSRYVSVITGKRRRAKLALITTSSSLGRSSVYNRLRIGGDVFLRSVGETKGFGHFHIPNALFEELRLYLSRAGHRYADGHAFGQGGNWRMRVIRECLSRLGLSTQMLRHGIAREVFVVELAENTRRYLQRKDRELDVSQLQTVQSISAAAIQRWVISRSFRRPEFRFWDRERFVDGLKLDMTAPES